MHARRLFGELCIPFGLWCYTLRGMTKINSFLNKIAIRMIWITSRWTITMFSLISYCIFQFDTRWLNIPDKKHASAWTSRALFGLQSNDVFYSSIEILNMFRLSQTLDIIWNILTSNYEFSFKLKFNSHNLQINFPHSYKRFHIQPLDFRFK